MDVDAMNSTQLLVNSTGSHFVKMPPALEQLGIDCFRAVIFQLVPLEMLYFAAYFRLKNQIHMFNILIFMTLAAFWLEPWITPINCNIAKSLQRFAIAIGSMKALDWYARRDSFFKYAVPGPRPAEWLQALYLTFELRYESFTPSPIKISKEPFHEPTQLGIHIAIFAVLQAFPQTWSLVMAYEVQLAIYIIWTALQLILRYENSPALFGPLYKAKSLSTFWSVTWHNAFTSPCNSLGYTPLRSLLPKLGVSVPAARSLGVLGAFALMAAFHMYAMAPVLSTSGMFRIGMFFFLNGVATVGEAAIWGRNEHWIKSLLAWGFESAIASWTAAGLDIPRGLWTVDWREFC